jgi:hypothetical protein
LIVDQLIATQTRPKRSFSVPPPMLAEAHGEFESEHPGYCGAQDTFYVGNLKSVGRIYQHRNSCAPPGAGGEAARRREDPAHRRSPPT